MNSRRSGIWWPVVDALRHDSLGALKRRTRRGSLTTAGATGPNSRSCVRALRGYRIPAVASSGFDQYMEATLWPRGGGVLSHDTALDLHDLCDVDPAKIHVTVAKDLRIRREVPAVYRLHHRDLAPVDVTRHEGIPIVTPLRAIGDGIEAHLGGHLIAQAIDTARRRGAITKDQERSLKTRQRDVLPAA